MLRVLVELGPFKIYSYGLMLMLAFALGIFLGVRRGRRRGIPAETVMDLSTQIVLAAILGSRILYVATHRAAYAGNVWDVLRVWEGGLTVYGGAGAAVLVSFLFCRRRGVPFLRMADALAPSTALGVGIARIGCFLNGCCFGRACDCSWAVRFPEGSLAQYALGDVAVHPAQIYASAAAIIVFAILVVVDRRPRREGFVFWLFLILFGTATFFTDFSRYWERTALIFRREGSGLSLNQILERGLAVLGGVKMAVLGRSDRAGEREKEDGTA
jgi:phosphatidylglycerol:prolipoprotein diacylglycerol transferase